MNYTPSPAPTWLGIDLVKNRWIFPLLGALTTLIGGAAYAFSVFVRPLEAEFGWTRAETVTAFSTAMFVFGLLMFVGGYFVDKYGPKIAFFVGAAFLVAAQILSAQVETVAGLVLSFGVIGGIGLGLTYAASTVAVSSRWFPDKKGAAIGFAVLGFGLGAAVSGPVWSAGIGAIGWRETYLWTGAVFALVLLIIGSALRFPPADWHFVPGQGWQPMDGAAAAALGQNEVAVDPQDLSFAEAVRTPQMWLTGLMFFLSIFGGLMAVSQLAAFARDAPSSGVGMAATGAGLVVMTLAIFNGAGRPAWGAISDLIGIRNAYMVVIGLMIAAMLSLSLAATPTALFVAAALTGFAFGGTLALNPILTTAFFGSSYVASIYGLVFLLGFGGGGFFGPLVGGMVRTATGNYDMAFLTAAATASAALVLAFFLVPKRGQEHLKRPRRGGP